jgi:hypothetical protein
MDTTKSTQASFSPSFHTFNHFNVSSAAVSMLACSAALGVYRCCSPVDQAAVGKLLCILRQRAMTTVLVAFSVPGHLLQLHNPLQHIINSLFSLSRRPYPPSFPSPTLTSKKDERARSGGVHGQPLDVLNPHAWCSSRPRRHETPVLAKRIELVHLSDDLVVLDKPCSLPVSTRMACVVTFSVNLYVV